MSSESAADSPDYARQPRVAVDVLQHDQRQVLFDGDPERRPPITPLTDGFDDQRALINWWQATSVRTFGHLPKRFPARYIVRDDNLQRVLTASEPSQAVQAERQRVLERVLEACETAYRDLETRAHEWLADNSSDREQDWTDIDPSGQRDIAMRPAFSRLDSEQARVLRQLWGGFTDREAVMRWVHSLPAVADFQPVLERHGVSVDLATWLARSDHARRQLHTATSEAEGYRERFAATMLLPAFGVRATRLQAGEQSRSQGSDNFWNEVRT